MRLTPARSCYAMLEVQSHLKYTLFLVWLLGSYAFASELLEAVSVPNTRDGLEMYEPAFGPFHNSITGRAVPVNMGLNNDEPTGLNLKSGEIVCYMVERDQILGKGANAGREIPDKDDSGDGEDGSNTEDRDGESSTNRRSEAIYLSANTCRQPQSTRKKGRIDPPPQLTMFISDSNTKGCPESLDDIPAAMKKEFVEGAAMLQANVTGDIYVGVAAPKWDASQWDGLYNFKIAASKDNYYYSYVPSNTSELEWMDSDANSVLLVTKDLATDPNQFQTVMKSEPPFELFAENEAQSRTRGVRASVCGLRTYGQILANAKGDGMLHELCRTKMTTRGPSGLPKQQFYLEKLNDSSVYTGILYKPRGTGGSGKRQVAGDDDGGVIYPAMKFQTFKGTGDNCMVVDSDFDFCDMVQWRVPGSDKISKRDLVRKYDNYARKMYENFKKVLMQIPCEAPPDQAYSLARGCKDCEEAYKRWLCTVAIPRCEDISSNNTHAIMRNLDKAFPNGTKLSEDAQNVLGGGIASNSARNLELDDEIKPGPYKEILPCDDMCYEVVQSCPAAIGFACPRPGMVGFDTSYSERGNSDDPLRCNSPGASRSIRSAAHSLSVKWRIWELVVCFAFLAAL